ncbi:unnamed protein product [Paramecium primaurelia]|uniref:Uncharacterized protein n=1 Tax=Paramecium primaurelia TaxID=5886 RepID=A0A8S1K8I5_PARPR|nr:unnamed protein product [Paramecium primaurelia]
MSQHNSKMNQNFLSQQYKSFNQINKKNIYNEVNKIIELHKSHNELKTKTKNKQIQFIIKYWTQKDNIITYFCNIHFIDPKKQPFYRKQNKENKAQFFDSNCRNQNQIQNQEFSMNNLKINIFHQKNSLTRMYQLIKIIKNHSYMRISTLQILMKIIKMNINSNYKLIFNQPLSIYQRNAIIQQKYLKTMIFKFNIMTYNINWNKCQHQKWILLKMKKISWIIYRSNLLNKLSGYIKMIQSNEVNQQKQYIDDRLKQLNQIKTTLINYFNNQNKQNSLFQYQQLSSRRNFKNNNVYISSENKKMFQIKYCTIILNYS